MAWACGCRVWCTLNEIFRIASWSLDALSKGEFPTMSHTNEPWSDEDPPHRQESGGNKMKHVCATLFVKGDWASFVTSLGFPSWSDGVRPCFFCNAFDDLYDHDGCDPLGLRWRDNGESDYFESCDLCEVDVTLNRKQHSDLIKHLKFDKRKAGSRGRAIMSDFSDLRLIAGDRLEAGADVVDVGGFDNLNKFPINCTCWRPGNQSLTRHRNPLFNFGIGISPFKALALDTLHVFYLGILKVYCRVAVWYLLLSPAFAGPGAADENHTDTLNIIQMM